MGYRKTIPLERWKQMLVISKIVLISAAFSLIISIISWAAILAIPIFGGIFALRLSLLFPLGLVEENLFPNFYMHVSIHPSQRGTLRNSSTRPIHFQNLISQNLPSGHFLPDFLNGLFSRIFSNRIGVDWGGQV
jgi:hypothetical protein